MFIEKQPKEQQEKYKGLLQALGGLSALFSDSPNPYLYYRSAERAFCKAFCAEDLSREDISYDAKKNGLGVGLKTFLYKNGSCLEKIAEFNSLSGILRSLQTNPESLIHKVAELRNKRIEFAKNNHGIDSSIYHCVVRGKGNFTLFECPLAPVNIDEIIIDKKSLENNTLVFTDNVNEYRFSLSKSTLFKRFDVKKNIITDIPVSVLEDPFKLIQTLFGESKVKGHQTIDISIILPLYSEKFDNVPLKSGLNQWNAGGRSRHEDEVYIQIPKWVSERFLDFFPSRDTDFTLRLPNGTTIGAKSCQDGGMIGGKSVGKALMSSPNKDLGKWILRDILKISPGDICTLDMLEELGVDSVEIKKISELQYKINFAPLGSYKKFCEMYRI